MAEKKTSILTKILHSQCLCLVPFCFLFVFQMILIFSSPLTSMARKCLFPWFQFASGFWFIHSMQLAAFCLHKNQARGEDTNRTRPQWQPPRSLIVVWHGADIYTHPLGNSCWKSLMAGTHTLQIIFSATRGRPQYVYAYELLVNWKI